MCVLQSVLAMSGLANDSLGSEYAAKWVVMLSVIHVNSGTTRRHGISVFFCQRHWCLMVIEQMRLSQFRTLKPVVI
jgi:hypothetical protein